MSSENPSRKGRLSMNAANITVSHPGQLKSTRRVTNVVRTSYGGGGGASLHASLPAGQLKQMSSAAVQNVAGSREKEKSEMTKLNMKLANHLEQTRFLQNTVATLEDELARLRKSKGFCQDRVREEYKEEMAEARDALANIKKELAALQAKNLGLEDKVETQAEELARANRRGDDLQNEINKLTALISDLEGECNAHRRQVENSEREKALLKEQLDALKMDNDRLRDDLMSAREHQINTQNEYDALLEEKQFDCVTYEEEIAELKRLIEELRSVTPKIQNKWKADFKDMIESLQGDYDEKVNIMQMEMKRKYDDQVMQLQNAAQRDSTDHVARTENKTLKTSISQNKSKMSALEMENDRLRKDLEAMQRKMNEECEECEREKSELREDIEALNAQLDMIRIDLEELTSVNLGLTMEIQCYAKLLAGEEQSMARSMAHSSNIQSSGGAALSSIVQSGGSGGGQSSQSSKPVIRSSESKGSVQFKKKTTGSVGFQSFRPDGTVIIVENTSASRTVDLSNWSIVRKHGRSNQQREISFTLPRGTTISPRASLKIFCAEYAADADPREDIVIKDVENFKVGNGMLLLNDAERENKATCEIIYNS